MLDVVLEVRSSCNEPHHTVIENATIGPFNTSLQGRASESSSRTPLGYKYCSRLMEALVVIILKKKIMHFFISFIFCFITISYFLYCTSRVEASLA
jgi:hypothetical protein